MRKAKLMYIFLSGILAVIFLLSGRVSANNSLGVSKLNPVWTITLENKLDGFTVAPYHVPNSNTVYIQSYTLINSETKSWDVGVVSAIEKTTGKEKCR